MKPISIPVVALGPGSHTEDETLNYMAMPSSMQTFRPPILPEPEDIQSSPDTAAMLASILAALDRRIETGVDASVDLRDLSPLALNLLNQILGEGEVSARIQNDEGLIRIQESVFAGVWRVQAEDAGGQTTLDRIEVTAIPALVRQHLGGKTPQEMPAEAAANLLSAPALLTEIIDRAARPESHIINLTLLPFSPADGDYLDQALGRGPASILSRGYGNCRISATGMPRVWWVQYFNSQDVLILNTIEIADVPEVALAAAEDLADSRERLAEVLDWLG